MKIEIDNLDLAIMEILTRNGKIKKTTTDLAKEIYECIDRTDIIKYTTKLTYRVKKLTSLKILLSEKTNNKSYYMINKDKVFYGECNISVADKEINVGEAMIIEMPNKRYSISFIGIV